MHACSYKIYNMYFTSTFSAFSHFYFSFLFYVSFSTRYGYSSYSWLFVCCHPTYHLLHFATLNANRTNNRKSILTSSSQNQYQPSVHTRTSSCIHSHAHIITLQIYISIFNTRRLQKFCKQHKKGHWSEMKKFFEYFSTQK